MDQDNDYTFLRAVYTADIVAFSFANAPTWISYFRDIQQDYSSDKILFDLEKKEHFSK